MPHVQSSMHVLSVTQVWSVQMFLLTKYANLPEGATNMEWDTGNIEVENATLR